MAAYTVQNNLALLTDEPIINLTQTGTAVRLQLTEFSIGAVADASAAQDIELIRSTNAGTTPTVLTEEPIDPVVVASTGIGDGGTYATNPTTGNGLYRFGMNQRATYRWVAQPGRPFVGVLTANNGLMLRARGSATFTISAAIIWDE